MRDPLADGPNTGKEQDFTGLSLKMWGKTREGRKRKENLDTLSERRKEFQVKTLSFISCTDKYRFYKESEKSGRKRERGRERKKREDKDRTQSG